MFAGRKVKVNPGTSFIKRFKGEEIKPELCVDDRSDVEKIIVNY